MAFETDMFSNCEGLFYCMALWSNSVTEGYFWSIILFAFGAVMFMATFNYGSTRAFGYASFSMALISLLLIQIDLIPLAVLTIVLILAALGIAFMFLSDR